MALKNWSLQTVTVDTVTDLVQPGAGNEAAVVGLTVCNHDASAEAVFSIIITNSSNTLEATIISEYGLTAGDTLFIDTKIFLSNQQKIRVESDEADTSFLASGDES